MTSAQDVLDFWFALDDAERFKRDDAIDAEIAGRFGALHAELSSSVPPEWRDGPQAILAAIIVLDQFSRNLFRDDGRAYAQDPAALALTDEAIRNGWDGGMSADEKQFLYMPLMHSERLADVERCITLMHEAGHADGEAFARRHAAVIARFGRYPARNAALARESSADEAEFLRAKPMGF